ncbi:hypothetical protein ACFX1R_020630 [Malus domestica]
MSSRAEEEEEEEERQGEQARHRFYYSPCSLFEHAIKAFLKCLGLHDNHHDYHSGRSAVTDDQNHHHPHPHPHTEREMKFTEEAVIVMASARSATRVPTSIARARPKNHNKPPLSSGKGEGADPTRDVPVQNEADSNCLVVAATSEIDDKLSDNNPKVPPGFSFSGIHQENNTAELQLPLPHVK